MSSVDVPTPALIRKLATAACVVALLPIGIGALVTTLKAGMAFADWPSSDGHNMLLYPWLNDFRVNRDKFVEHGHRLAGVLIGIVSLLLAGAAWKRGRRMHRVFATAILLAVIAQGGIGGARVLFDQQALAFTHSLTGASFFCLCVVFRLMCSDGRPAWTRSLAPGLTPGMVACILVTPLAIAGQYVLGGLLRHFHTMLSEHLAGAVLAGLLTTATCAALFRSGHPLLRRTALALAGCLMLQLLLGAASYVTRFGLQQVGFVATSGSEWQAIACSLHTVVGMLLLASSVCSAVSTGLLLQAGCVPALNPESAIPHQKGAVG